MKRGRDRILNPGDFRQRVTIEAPPTGQSDSGARTGDWTPVMVWPCMAEPGAGSEQAGAGMFSPESLFKFTGHWVSGVTTLHRLNMGGRLFEILDVSNVEERNRELQITAREGISHGV